MYSTDSNTSWSRGHNGALRSSNTNKKYDLLGSLPAKGIEPEARNFLIQTLDPFHDNTINLMPVPDGHSRQSRILRKTNTTTFTVPANSTYGVTSLPILSYVRHQRWKDQGFNMVASTGADLDFDMGFINITDESKRNEPNWAGYWLKSWSPDPLGRGYGTTNDGKSINTSKQYRVIGAGYELHNVTATLTRGGSIASISQPHVANQHQLLFRTGAGFANIPTPIPGLVGQCDIGMLPPPAEIASDIVNYTVWDSSFGSYTVIPIDSYEFNSESYRPRLYQVRSETTGGGAEGGAVYIGSSIRGNIPIPGETGSYIASNEPASVLGTPVVIGQDYGANAICTKPLLSSNTSVCTQYISTATEAQTFRLEVRVFLEELPLGDSDYGSTNANSAYCPRAMELARLYFLTNFPTCYVSENASGGWFKNVVATLGRIAPSILGSIPKIGPVAEQVANIILPKILPSVDAKAKKAVDTKVNAISSRIAPTIAVRSPSAKPALNRFRIKKTKKKIRKML